MCPFICRILLVLVAALGSSVVAEKTQCEVFAAKAALENQNTVVNTTYKRLIGTWLSEGCEIRPGPQYVLRSYSFRSVGTYKVIQHHYWDNSCSSPKFTVVSYGFIRLKKDNMLNTDAASGYIRPINISVIPHDTKSVKELEKLVATECPEHSWKPWRRYEEHLVFEASERSNKFLGTFNFPNIFTFHDQNTINNQQELLTSSGYVACMGDLKWAFNELKLLKVQTRPVFGDGFASTARLELLVGDIHSRREMRERYIPTGFQVPLLKYIKEDEFVEINARHYTILNVCNICSSLYSSDKTPPHLLEKPHLPPYIWGEWTSMRCEVRPMGLYLTRKFSFYSENFEWIGEHKFFQDPFCALPKFTVTAAGHFFFGSSSEVVQGSTNIDFNIEKASLTPFSKRVAYEMRMYSSCGRHQWQAGVPQELTSTNGCLQLGIITPSIQHEVVKIEMDYQGACLLYLGQSDTENLPRISSDRPTAFQVPLIKCGHLEHYSQGLEEILDYPNSYNDSNIIKTHCYHIFLSLILFVLSFT